jgi:hypothetical protein
MLRAKATPELLQGAAIPFGCQTHSTTTDPRSFTLTKRVAPCAAVTHIITPSGANGE